jgi:hypothetical protein
MPFSIVTDHPECSGYAVIKDSDSELLGCHRTENQAQAQLTALNIAEYGQRVDGYTPTAAMKTEAQRGLDWRSEYGRGGTEIGIARARDISNGKQLPLETVNRMVSFFARHEVDKQAEGFSPGEDGYPSNGRIAWALWGGDAGRSWAENIVSQNRNEDEYQDRALPDNYRPASSEDVPEGRNCGNCIFNLNLYCTKWQAPIAANYYCNAWQPMETRKQKALDILQNLNSIRYNLSKS